MRLNCKLMDADRNGASWSDEMRVTLEGVDGGSEPEAVARLVDQATYELVTGGDGQSPGKVVRWAGTASNGICWVDDADGCGVVIHWEAA